MHEGANEVYEGGAAHEAKFIVKMKGRSSMKDYMIQGPYMYEDITVEIGKVKEYDLSYKAFFVQYLCNANLLLLKNV